MRYVVIMLLVALTASINAYAQVGGHLGLYSDPNRSDCQVLETYPGIFQVFVVHEFTPGALASVFSIPIPSCASVSWLSDTSDYGFLVGFSPLGIGVFYKACVAAPIVALRVLYLGSTGQACCPLAIGPSTAPGELPYPYAIDCGHLEQVVTVSPAYFNANTTCGCTVPTQETTWGRLKATYGK